MRHSTVSCLRRPPRQLVRSVIQHAHSRFAQPSHLTALLVAAPRPLVHAARNRRSLSSSQKFAECPDISSKGVGMEWYDLSPERKIQLSLGPGPGAKWGWVIYRTTFRPDLDRHWDSFKQLVMENIMADVAASDAPELINQMDFVFVEDPSLENAKLETMKRRFRAWAIADGTDPTEEQGLTRDTRHAFFIQVDEASLLSLLSNPGTPTALSTAAKLAGTHVNIVRGWEDGPEGERWTSLATRMFPRTG